MEPLRRTGGTTEQAQALAAKARLERLALEAAKYTLPGVAVPKDGEPAPPPPPTNLAQLRAWVEQHDGGIDVLA